MNSTKRNSTKTKLNKRTKIKASSIDSRSSESFARDFQPHVVLIFKHLNKITRLACKFAFN